HKIHLSPYENVADVLKAQVAALEIHSAQHHRIRGCATNLKIGAAIQTQGAAREINPVARGHAEIQLYIIGKALRGSGNSVAREVSNEVHEVKIGSEGELIDTNLSGQ